MSAIQHLTPQPPVYNEAQARAVRQLRKARAAMAKNPKLPAAELADERQYQQLLDRWTPHTLNRWLATAGLLAVFFLRIVLSQGVSTVHIPFLARKNTDRIPSGTSVCRARIANK